MADFLPAEILRKKRDGGTLSADEIAFFVEGISSGAISEGQIGAFAMSTFLNGMAPSETVALTLAMRDSGDVIGWDDTGLPAATLIDKHSSGGTGDEKVSLILAPLVAACGINMPMISARGLGHTGGEVDLMEVIPGCDIAPPADVFKAAVTTAGAAIIGPTGRLAPADAAIYYVRDVTATVESIPLITSSILSKKLAAGISGLVMSVNFGSGAFMPTVADAGKLSSSLIGVAEGAGLAMVTLIANMDEVMGDAIGSRLQVKEAIAFLSGGYREPRMLQLVMNLASEILRLGGIATTDEEARSLLRKKLDDGSAAARFGKMVAALGGPSDLLEDVDRHLETAPFVAPVYPAGEGFVQKVDAFAVGLAMVGLGAGRKRPTDGIDHGVGLTGIAHVGDGVGPGKPLCHIHARSGHALERAAGMIRDAVLIGPEKAAPLPVTVGRMATSGL